MRRRKKKSMWNKPAAELTVKESLQVSGVITLASVALCAIPLIWECRDDIRDAIKGKRTDEEET